MGRARGLNGHRIASALSPRLKATSGIAQRAADGYRSAAQVGSGEIDSDAARAANCCLPPIDRLPAADASSRVKVQTGDSKLRID